MRLLSLALVAALILAACDEGVVGDDDVPAENGPSPESAIQDDGLFAREPERQDDTVAEEPPQSDALNEPTGYASLYHDGVDPALDVIDGEISVTVGPADRTSLPILVHNGTDSMVSRAEVSGAILDAGGDTIVSGSSQGFDPNVVEPGAIAVGHVYAGPHDLPADATLEDPGIDYTEGLHEFENRLTVDVETVDSDENRITGLLTNPHEVPVTGPIGVTVICLDESGVPTSARTTFADRDNIEAGGSSTFTINLFDDPDCSGGVLAGSSGYTEGS